MVAVREYISNSITGLDWCKALSPKDMRVLQRLCHLSGFNGQLDESGAIRFLMNVKSIFDKQDWSSEFEYNQTLDFMEFINCWQRGEHFIITLTHAWRDSLERSKSLVLFFFYIVATLSTITVVTTFMIKVLFG